MASAMSASPPSPTWRLKPRTRSGRPASPTWPSSITADHQLLQAAPPLSRSAANKFNTDNDSELIAVYLADKLKQGSSLKDALRDSIADLDGTFSFLVSTKDEIGYAKDRLAVKADGEVSRTDDLIAIASEEVSLNRLFPGTALNTSEPPPGTFETWRRSI